MTLFGSFNFGFSLEDVLGWQNLIQRPDDDKGFVMMKVLITCLNKPIAPGNNIGKINITDHYTRYPSKSLGEDL